MKQEVFAPLTATAVFPPPVAAFIAYSGDRSSRKMRHNRVDDAKWKQGVPYQPRTTIRRNVVLVPTWYKCPWGLKIVICLSKFPCDILELKKVQKKQTKKFLKQTLITPILNQALLEKMLVWRVGTGNLWWLRLGSKVTDKRKQESQNCSRTNQKKSSLWNNLAAGRVDRCWMIETISY